MVVPAGNDSNTVVEQPAKLMPVWRQIFEIKNTCENYLNVDDVAPDGDDATQYRLEICRSRQMIGMGVRLEKQIDFEFILADVFDNSIGRRV